MNTPPTPRPEIRVPSSAERPRGSLPALSVFHLLLVGLLVGAVIACFASTERRDAIVLARLAELDALNGMRIVEQAASAAEDYQGLARTHFDAAVARARPGQRMPERLGVWLAQRGQFDLATPYLIQALRADPGYDLAIVAASAAGAIGDTEATTEAYVIAIRLRPESPLAYNNLAYHYAVEGIQLGQAEMLAQRALELVDPGTFEASSYWDTLAWVYYRQGRFREAREAMEQVDPRFLADPIVRQHLEAIEAALAGEARGRPGPAEPTPEESEAVPGEPQP